MFCYLDQGLRTKIIDIIEFLWLQVKRRVCMSRLCCSANPWSPALHLPIHRYVKVLFFWFIRIWNQWGFVASLNLRKMGCGNLSIVFCSNKKRMFIIRKQASSLPEPGENVASTCWPWITAGQWKLSSQFYMKLSIRGVDSVVDLGWLPKGPLPLWVQFRL